MRDARRPRSAPARPGPPRPRAGGTRPAAIPRSLRRSPPAVCQHPTRTSPVKPPRPAHSPPSRPAQAGTAYASHPPAVTGHNPLPHTPGTANQPAVAGQAPVAPPGNPAIPHDEQRPGGVLHNLPFRNNVAPGGRHMNNGARQPDSRSIRCGRRTTRRAGANFNGGTVAGYGPGPVPGEVPAAPASWPDTLLRLISIAEAEANAAHAPVPPKPNSTPGSRSRSICDCCT